MIIISKLFYKISRAVRQVKFGTILKYHKWYLCQISRTIHAINNYCLYYNLRNSVIYGHVFIFVELSRFLGEQMVLKFLFSAQLDQTLSLVDVLFSVFWFSEFSFSSWISWFQNLEIFPPFLRYLCDEII